jgi:hypothetical protein
MNPKQRSAIRRLKPDFGKLQSAARDESHEWKLRLAHARERLSKTIREVLVEAGATSEVLALYDEEMK